MATLRTISTVAETQAAPANGKGKANGTERNGALSNSSATANNAAATANSGATTPLTRPVSTERALVSNSDEMVNDALDVADADTAEEDFYETPFRKVDLAAALAPLALQLEAVEGEIERLITSSVKSVADVASHTLGAGGKRLRPALTVLAAQLCGDNSTTVDPRVLSCAAAIELTHTTTLLHDDVVDSAEVRRGKPAANLLWGNGMSVLVGDYLFAQVFLIASQKGFVELMHPLAEATSKMCAGELLEVQHQGRHGISEAEYEEVIALKTAALTECATHIGALAVNAPEEYATRLARYGYHLGMGFQIVDDVFDVVATRARIGKPVGNDIREGTMTLPMLRALQVAPPADAGTLREIIGKSPIGDEDVVRALQIIRSGDAVEYSLNKAAEHIALAKAQLEIFGESTARTMLEEIADYVLSRDK